MNKAVLGLVLGGILGAVDGLSAWFYPDIRDQMVGIVLGSTFKGLVAGIITGLVARKLQSLALGILVGLLAALLCTLPVALTAKNPVTQGSLFWEITIPGAICGLIVGFATQRYGVARKGDGGVAKAATLLLAAAAGVLPGCAATVPEDGLTGGKVDAAAAFARMKTLEGTWTVPMPDGMGPPAMVIYDVTSGGHAVQEKLFAGSDHEMVTMYYLEGRELVLVHYCAMGNRPHMRLDRAQSTIDDLRFEWDAGATDIDATREAHIHSGRIQWKDAEVVDCRWQFWQEGKQAGEHAFALDRKNRAP